MTKEQKARMKAIEEELEMEDMTNYDEWADSYATEREEYRERELPEITKYFEEHIKGKSWEEIDCDRRDWYSDWHKDVFGFRPRQTRVLGEKY